MVNSMTKPAKLAHHFLVPTWQMDDPRFLDTVIYICRHSDTGSWGFIINRPTEFSIGALLDKLELPTNEHTAQTPAMHGGPVRPEAGFVLHTGLPDYKASFVIAENICMTTSKDIIEHLGQGKLRHAMLCMGYCNWTKGQLEQEIADGDWLVCPADLQTLFGLSFDERLPHILGKLGVNQAQFLHTTGRA